MKDPNMSRSGPGGHVDLQRFGDSPRSSITPTAEHLGYDNSKWSPHSLPGLRRGHQDFEEDQIHSPLKKSVFSKVKERARRFRHSLSGKKKQLDQDGNTTPSWGFTLDDDDEDGQEDAEYFGAPMYESELAPEGYRENARQHPRAISVTPEKHVLTSSINHDVAQEEEKPVVSPSKSLTETVTEKLAPAYATVSDATAAIASKLHDLSISTSSSTPPTNKLPAGECEKNLSPTTQIWDKGVSVKEYIRLKFEPGEDERALSQVITDAMSPKKSPRGEGGIVEKVKEAVTSFIWNEQEPSQSSTAYSTATNEVVEEENHRRLLQAN